MNFENKILSREISRLIWEKEKTIGTAESCTGGRIAEALVLVPGASNYFKGSIVSYTNEIKERLLGVSHDVLEEKTAVCEEVAVAMVRGAIKTLQVDYAISATGIAGPGGGTPEHPVGTIWLACGSADDVVTLKLDEDRGRALNLSHATTTALQLFLDYLKTHLEPTEEK
ncbi:MAG: CinA family protein [Prevotella sp.]|nr:CinA family protein [Prevotella sp.]